MWGACFLILHKGVARQRIHVHASVLEVFGLFPNFSARAARTWYLDIVSTCSFLCSRFSVSVPHEEVGKQRLSWEKASRAVAVFCTMLGLTLDTCHASVLEAL